jgi:hypothetical protein
VVFLVFDESFTEEAHGCPCSLKHIVQVVADWAKSTARVRGSRRSQNKKYGDAQGCRATRDIDPRQWTFNGLLQVPLRELLSYVA